MAEILVYEGESPEKATERFKRLVIKEGILSTLKSRNYFQSPSQKRRLKSKKAQKRQRKIERIARRFEPLDNKSEGYQFWRSDVEHGWPIDLNPKSLKAREDFRTRQIEEPKPAEEPTEYASCIFGYIDEVGIERVILVQNDPTKDKVGIMGRRPDSNPRFGFPGGEVNSNETPPEGARRESKEETGFTLFQVTDKDLVHTEKAGNHTKYFYAGRIADGAPKLGEELLKMEGRTIESLAELVGMGYLRTSHRRAFEKYLEWRKSR